MRHIRRNILVVALLAFSACPATPIKPPKNPIPADCPEPLEPMGVIAQFEALSRLVREARANQMTRVRQTKKGAPPIVATLHDPQLAFLEGILAEPASARRADAKWLRRYQSRFFVELRSQAPLQLEGQPIAISDDRGSTLTALYLTERKSREAMVYRLFFDGQAAEAQTGLRRLTLRLPGYGEAKWGISSHNLSSADDLPLVDQLESYRDLHFIRRQMLSGATTAAIAALQQEVRCSAGDASSALLQVARAFVPPKMSAADSEEPKLAGADGKQMRSALSSWLAAWAKAGLIDPEAVKAAAALLEGANAEGLVAFDRRIGELLISALAPQSKLHRPGASGPKVAAGETSSADFLQELKGRVARAAADVLPAQAKLDKKPTVGAAEQLAQLRGKLPDGSVVVARAQKINATLFTHVGLPSAEYRAEMIDNAAPYWRARVAKLASVAELRPVARALLNREMHSPSLAVAALAMQGLAQLDGIKAASKLAPLVADKRPARAAAALVAHAHIRHKRILTIGQMFSLVGDPMVRAAAMVLIASQPKHSRAVIRKAMNDPKAIVARGALMAGLQNADPQAASKLGARLSAATAEQRRALLTDLADVPVSSVAPLKRALLSQLHGSKATTAAVRAAGRLLKGAAARPLLKLFARVPALQKAILSAVEGAAYQKLFKKAVKSDNATIRRLALVRLGKIDRAPAAIFEAALSDPDQGVKLAAHAGLARLGRSASLLALGSGARGSCAERILVMEPLAKMMDRSSRSKLFADALNSPCSEIHDAVWGLVIRHQPTDIEVLRTALGHRRRRMRVLGALTALGLRKGAALGSIQAAYVFHDKMVRSNVD